MKAKNIKIIICSFLLFLFSFGCKEKLYEVDYKGGVRIKVNKNNLKVANKSRYPVILIDMIFEDSQTNCNLYSIKNGNYTKYGREIILDTSKSNNQYIFLNWILLPSSEANIKLSKKEEFTLRFSPVKYNFLSDYVFIKDEAISSNEIRFKTITVEEWKKKKGVYKGAVFFTSGFNKLEEFQEEIEWER